MRNRAGKEPFRKRTRRNWTGKGISFVSCPVTEDFRTMTLNPPLMAFLSGWTKTWGSSFDLWRQLFGVEPIDHGNQYGLMGFILWEYKPKPNPNLVQAPTKRGILGYWCLGPMQVLCALSIGTLENLGEGLRRFGCLFWLSFLQWCSRRFSLKARQKKSGNTNIRSAGQKTLPLREAQNMLLQLLAPAASKCPNGPSCRLPPPSQMRGDRMRCPRQREEGRRFAFCSLLYEEVAQLLRYSLRKLAWSLVRSLGHNTFSHRPAIGSHNEIWGWILISLALLSWQRPNSFLSFPILSPLHHLGRSVPLHFFT